MSRPRVPGESIARGQRFGWPGKGITAVVEWVHGADVRVRLHLQSGQIVRKVVARAWLESTIDGTPQRPDAKRG